MNAMFDSDRFYGLLKKSGLTYSELARLTGISLSSVNLYARGKAMPRFNQLLTLADFFAVPVDYLIGRMDLDMTDYAKYYMRLRRGQYEDAVKHGREHFGKGIETPWPYNLLDEVIQGRWKDVLTEDQEAALEQGLNSLTERERLALEEYFGNGGTLETTGRLFDVGRERARQIIAKAVRKLRHPMRLKRILYGLYGYERKIALEREDLMLDDMEELLMHRRAVMEQLVEEKEKVKIGLTTEEMDLSVRSYNCLKRANIDTLDKLMEYTREHGYTGLCRIRNLGRRSLTEIFKRMEELTGIDWEKVAIEADGNDKC